MATAAACVLALLALPSVAGAALVEGFENGFGLNTTRLGDVGLVDRTFFTPPVNPPQGSQQALLTTLSAAGGDDRSFSGTDAASVTAVESFLNLIPGTLASRNGGTPGDASAFRIGQLSLNPGDVLSFSFNFLTQARSTDGQDFAFVTLQLGSGDPIFYSLASVGDARTPSQSALFNPETETGSRFFALPAVTRPGSYTLGIGITDADDDAIGSGLLIDNVQVNAVPEPSAVLLGVFGGCLLGAPRVLRRLRGGKLPQTWLRR